MSRTDEDAKPTEHAGNIQQSNVAQCNPQGIAGFTSLAESSHKKKRAMGKKLLSTSCAFARIAGLSVRTKTPKRVQK
jgi:hypothetical protein